MTGIQVLLADDQTAIMDRVEQMLDGGFDVVAKVCDGQALLDVVAASPPEILVIDISMPRVDGIEATRRLRALGVELPILFLTVHDDPDLALAAFDAGGNGYVVKSRLVSDLRSCIKEVMSGRRFVSPTESLSAVEPRLSAMDD